MPARITGTPRHLHNKEQEMIQANDIAIDIGIQEQDGVALRRVCRGCWPARTPLYLKTHNFHWNVTGPMFNSLHLMFEQQYTQLAAVVDEIAERIRALVVVAPGSYSQFAELTSITEETGTPCAEQMIAQLVRD